MINVKKIFPECFADTLLIELILQRGKPPHYHGINNVGKALEKYNSGDIIIGVVDTDKFKRPDPIIEQFTEVVEDCLADHGLLFKKMPGTNKHVVRVHPTFEPWIWEQARLAKIGGGQFGFNSIKQLADAAKTEEVFENKDFKKFVNAVVGANMPAMLTLRRWLNLIEQSEEKIVNNET